MQGLAGVWCAASAAVARGVRVRVRVRVRVTLALALTLTLALILSPTWRERVGDSARDAQLARRAHDQVGRLPGEMWARCGRDVGEM